MEELHYTSKRSSTIQRTCIDVAENENSGTV